MLTLRKEQMAALEAVAWRNFQEIMVRRFELKLPRRFEELGEPEVRRIAAKSIRKGIQYAFENRDDVTRLAELMIEFAPDFDDDPRYAWARELIEQTAVPSSHRMALLVYRMTGRTDDI